MSTLLCHTGRGPAIETFQTPGIRGFVWASNACRFRSVGHGEIGLEVKNGDNRVKISTRTSLKSKRADHGDITLRLSMRTQSQLKAAKTVKMSQKATYIESPPGSVHSQCGSYGG